MSMYFRIQYIIMLLCLTCPGIAFAETSIWKQADEAYSAGEKASTIAQRQDSFNQALKLYEELESTYNPTFGDGKLYYNIGNTYFQLEEYPWAVLYYYRAQALRPRDSRIVQNLEITQNKLGLKPQAAETSIFQKILFFRTYLSLPEQLQLLFVLGILLLVLLSVRIWTHYSLKYAIYLVSIFWIIMLVNVAYTRYYAPIEGVILKSAALYRDAGEEYAKVSGKPILEGSKVQVVDVVQDGKWLKVLSPTGEVGYLPLTTVRII